VSSATFLQELSRVYSHSVDATQGEGRKRRCSANELCDREDVIDDDVDYDDDDD